MTYTEQFAAHMETMGETLLDTLGITLTEMKPERVVATMPVASRVFQPFGLLHGGASVALAETIASVGACLHVDLSVCAPVGQEINANHVRSVRSGTVTGIGTPLHVGRTSQVWEVRIVDDEQRLVCVSRCTIAVVPHKR